MGDKINRYRYNEAVRISKELVVEGMIVGNELTEYVKGLGIKFKTENDLYEFENMLIDCLEKRKRHIVITDSKDNKEYKFENAKDASNAISIQPENIRTALYRDHAIRGRLKVRYDYWTTKDLMQGVKYHKGKIDFNQKDVFDVGSTGKSWSKYLNSKIKVTDTFTGIPMIFKDGHSVCSKFKINRNKVYDCIKKECKLNGRFVLELIS